MPLRAPILLSIARPSGRRVSRCNISQSFLQSLEPDIKLWEVLVNWQTRQKCWLFRGRCLILKNLPLNCPIFWHSGAETGRNRHLFAIFYVNHLIIVLPKQASTIKEQNAIKSNIWWRPDLRKLPYLVIFGNIWPNSSALFQSKKLQGTTCKIVNWQL